MNERANIFKITKHLAEFGSSSAYVRISEQVNSDYDLIKAYADSFMFEVQSSNQKIKAELTL